jgi:predicted dehydrogenase
MHARTELVALCDLLPERLQVLGAELGVSACYDDFGRMIAEQAPDIVAIPTGTELHYELSMGVLEHGVHIDVEKPLCTDLQEADRLLEKAAAQGVQVAVHHQGRSGASMKAVQGAEAEGRIGVLRFLQGSGKGYYAGYGLMNIGTHAINAMLGVAGPVCAVTAMAQVAGRSPQPQDAIQAAGGMGYVVGESITATLEFATGVQGVLLQHRFPQVDSRAYTVEFCGSEGRLLWRTGEAWYLPTAHYVPGGVAWQKLDLALPEGFDAQGKASEPDYSYVDDYVRALDAGGEHESSGAEGRHVLEIILGIFEAAVYGRRVALPQQDRSHPLLRWRREADLPAPAAVQRGYADWLADEDRRLGN